MRWDDVCIEGPSALTERMGRVGQVLQNGFFPLSLSLSSTATVTCKAVKFLGACAYNDVLIYLLMLSSFWGKTCFSQSMKGFWNKPNDFATRLHSDEFYNECNP